MNNKLELYIQNTYTIWGNDNGEVCLETNDGTVITWNARSLYDDLPSLIAMTHIELEKEDKLTKQKWNALGKKIVKDYKLTKKKGTETK